MTIAPEIVLPATATSPRAARRWVESRLRDLGLECLDSSVLLLTSEVVTNAARHAGTQLRLRLRPSGPGVRVEVSDGSTSPPVRGDAAPDATQGRGVGLLDVLADDWGWEPEQGGKTVWFCVHRPMQAWSVDADDPHPSGTR